MFERKISSVEKWPKHKGKHDLLRHLRGERLTQREAIIAKCYECCGGFEEGSCFCDVPECSLSQYMPFKNKPSGRDSTTSHRK